ncbi:MAG: DNA-deoxyinosine glycosylase [Eubacterium sp.]|nr:DNA-deoxyinosine glycosylase [Eubacterium sp.]
MNEVVHPIEPVYDKNSKILILGSFPSVKSREQGFFYGHPQNRFWRVLAGVFQTETPNTIEDKKRFLIENGVALWDVIHSCEIVGSSDSSIKNAVPNDIKGILKDSNIQFVFTNGKTADRLYKQYIEPDTEMSAVCLPSTSPANAAWSLEMLIDRWSKEVKGVIL